MDRKLATSVGAIALIGAAVALTANTYSYFSSDAHSGTQSVQAGTLTLQMGGTASQNNTFSNIVPGWSDQKILTFQNTGSVDGTLTLTGNALGDEALLNKVNMHITSPSGISDRPLAQVGGLQESVPLGHGQMFSVSYTLSVPTTAENEIQGEDASFSVSGHLEQNH